MNSGLAPSLGAKERKTMLTDHDSIKISRNSVKCHICLSEIESVSVHHYLTCTCGNIAVDGGKEYLRRVGKGLADNSFTDTSVYVRMAPKEVIDVLLRMETEKLSDLRDLLTLWVKSATFNNKLEKIRLVRSLTGCGLKEAKDLVEELKVPQ